VASALSVAGTCRKGRALVLHHHKAAQLVVGFLVRHLLSVAGSPFSPHFTSLPQGTTLNPDECDRGLTRSLIRWFVGLLLVGHSTLHQLL
jgi:hypothetical protein